MWKQFRRGSFLGDIFSEDAENTVEYCIVGSIHSIWFVLASSALLCAPTPTPASHYKLWLIE